MFNLFNTPLSLFNFSNLFNFLKLIKVLLHFQDNGNVEIYDRLSRKLSCVLAGQYSISPVGLDINSSFILVNYTCAFVNRFACFVLKELLTLTES
jgi:hypothetical protein